MQPNITQNALPAATHVGAATLRVAQLERSLRFYEGMLGFQRLAEEPGRVVLGALESSRPLLILQEVPGARPQPRRATGLYHAAILLPTRGDLGRMLSRLAQAGSQIGQADHLVSEALYISDPDDNGLEIYRDRPRTDWHWTNGMVEMAADPLDIRGLLAAGEREGGPWLGLPAGTTLGHMHLQVGNLEEAERFYHKLLGFEITAKSPNYPGAIFVGAGGYHHHLGLNTWHSLGMSPTPKEAAGLQGWEIVLPASEALAAVQQRLEAASWPSTQAATSLSVLDPWDLEVIVRVEDSTPATAAH